MNQFVMMFTLTLFLFHSFSMITCAKILIIFPLPAFSHFKSFQPLFEELAIRGHELTIISGQKLHEKFTNNYTHIDIKDQFHRLKIRYSEMRRQNRIENLVFTLHAVHEYNEVVIQDYRVQRLLHSSASFDLILTEFFYVDVYFAFGYRFDAPVIALSPLPLIPYYNWVLQNPNPPNYIPNLYLPFTEKMSISERFINVGTNLLMGLYYELIAVPKYQRQMEKFIPFGGKPVPRLRDLLGNTSITLVNSHYSLHYVKPLLPNVIETAGLHIVPKQPLPPKLQAFMDDASIGVIYVSLGSLIEPHLVTELGHSIINVLSQLPHQILFKWNPSLFTKVPSNILIQEWLPQVDILNHPNCRLFITHGGLHSLIESINASVPLIGIPFFTDQHHNLAVAEYHKIGKTVTIESVETQLLSAIQEILNNNEYYENIKLRSQLFNERQSSPLDTAIYWIDHVLRHKGAPHLRSYALSLPWYVNYLFDVLILSFIGLALVSYLTYRAINSIHYFVSKKREQYEREIDKKFN